MFHKKKQFSSINLEKKIIIYNYQKHNIYHTINIDENFKIFYAKKRFLNLFKGVERYEHVPIINMEFFITEYINHECIFDNLEYFFENNNKKIVIGFLNGEIIIGKQIMEILDLYKITNSLIK